jgi:hypothetical protein
MNDSLTALILSFLVFFVTGFVAAVFTVLNTFRLLSYLKSEKYSRWVWLTSIGKVGPGLKNLFRLFPYIYGELDNENQNILRYKHSIRKGHIYFALLLLACFVNLGLIYYLLNKFSI